MLLKDLISLPIYANAAVVAGREGMSNTVQSVNIMDAPDIIHYLKPQELLLTTGYAMKDHPEELLSLVSNMAKVGCAGLAIKTKRFFRVVPAEIIKRANELHFPIIELSLEQSLGDIANQSLSHILEKRTVELNYALTTHKQFSQMIMQGKSMHDIINELSVLISSPVMLVNRHFELLCRSGSLTERQCKELLPSLQGRIAFVSLPKRARPTPAPAPP